MPGKSPWSARVGQTFKALFCYTPILIVIITTLLVACSEVESSPAGEKLQGKIAERYPLLSESPLGSATFTSLPEDILVRSGDVTVTSQDIAEEIAKSNPNIRSQLEENAFFILEQKFTERVLFSEARNSLAAEGRNVSELPDNEIIQIFIAELVDDITPTAEEMSDFYAANRELMGGMPYDRVKEQIEMFLQQQKQQEFVNDYIRNILQVREIEISDIWSAERIAVALDNGVDNARKKGRPTMVNFGSDSCVPCQMMIPAREAVKEKFDGKADVVYVHTDREQILSARYGIQSIPTLIFFDQDGNEVHRHVGIMEQQEMEEWLNSILES